MHASPCPDEDTLSLLADDLLLLQKPRRSVRTPGRAPPAALVGMLLKLRSRPLRPRP